MNYKQEINNISQWISNYQKESGCDGYVIGISGGLDSAIVTSLCCQAIGKGKVIAIYLPCESSLNMEEDAIQLAKNLGIELRVSNLIDSYNSIIQKLEEGGETVNQSTKANIKARLRMTMLFALANQYNYLMAGTSNLSELMVGYFTKFGDGGVDIEPIGNYYKTEIYKMAELMPEIPDSIKTKAPSADLSPGQTDEKNIGMPYSEIDKILKGLDPNDSQNLEGINRDNIKKIKDMIKKAEHKNNLPPRYER